MEFICELLSKPHAWVVAMILDTDRVHCQCCQSLLSITWRDKEDRFYNHDTYLMLRASRRDRVTVLSIYSESSTVSKLATRLWHPQG